jgi:hypothetical protein
MSSEGIADAIKRNPLGSVVVVGVIVILAVAVARTQGLRAGRLGPRGKVPAPTSAAALLRAIDAVPILEQEQARADYVNARVEWPVVVEDLTRDEGRRAIVYELVAKDPRQADVEILAIGFGGNDLPALKRLRRNQSIRIAGRIEDVGRRGVVLTEAKIASKVP